MQISGIQSSTTTQITSQAKAAVDPRDTNGDGVVSIDEIIAYDRNHPELSAQSASANQYTQSGAMAAQASGTGSSLNLYA